ncbi:MAG: T9SS type A sorting domain-containing protein [Clostridiales bacterium]|nr:T9SS type A sorting domain-containing protein [Clostridiales bacterium]
MKKTFTLFSAAAICSVGVSAQIGSSPITTFGDHSLDFVPMEYTTDGVAQLYSRENNDDIEQYTIFNSDFNQISQFSVNKTATQLKTTRYSKLKSVDVTVDYTNINTEYDGDGPSAPGIAYTNSSTIGTFMDHNMAFNQMKNMFGDNVTEVNNNGDYYYYISNEYYNEDQYGTKYPMRYGVWTSSNYTLRIVENQYNEFPTFSRERATYFCMDRGFSLNEINGQTYFYPQDPWRYFLHDRFENKYPTQYYHLSDNGILYRYDIEYRADAQIADDWILERSWTDESNSIGVVGVEPMMAKLGNVDMNEFNISQTLFNNDAEYEYILPIVQIAERENISEEYVDGIGSYPCKEVSEYEKCIGFKVLSQSGSEITRVILPSEYSVYYSDYIYVIDFGDKRYLSIEAIKDDNVNEEYVLIYKIDPTASAMELMNDPVKVSVTPRATRRSTPITVKFNGESKNDRQVIVTGANGMKALTKSVAGNETSTTIDTSRLAQGMYIVTVIEEGKNIENCKIVIR